MRVAVPIWERRVSPVFDSALRVLIAEIKDKQVISRFIIPFKEGYPLRRASLLNRWEIDALICGGISSYLARLIVARGIKLIPGIRGDVDKVLEAYRQGDIPSTQYMMPGWRGWSPEKYTGRIFNVNGK